jgi:hypothetical protein
MTYVAQQTPLSALHRRHGSHPSQGVLALVALPRCLSSSGMKSPRSASLQEYKGTNVVEAASRILGRPYQRSSSASGTKPTIIASRTQQTPAERTKIAIFLPTHDKKPSYNIVEQEMTDERQQTFEASHMTVGDGCMLARNNDTGEFRLVGKHMSLLDDLSATSPDYINEEGFYVSFPPPSSSTSDGTAPSPSQPSGQDTEVHMSRIHKVISVMKVCLSHLLCLGCLSQTIAPDAIVHTKPSMQSTRMREVGFRRSLLHRTGSGSGPSYLFSLNRS